LDASSKSDYVGQRLLHYQVTERIGAGGLGVVCRAIDLKQKRTVALKFFPASLTAGEEAKMRFVREMRTVSTLEHPNIGALLALEETGDGRLFLVMAYYEGPTLDKRIDQGPPITPNEAVSVSLQLLQGLAEAHKRGVVHGDAKPENLIFTGLGVLKILDFGMAKFYGSPDLVPSSISGTVAYMSPERANGAPADRRSDLWAAGVVLHEMLTGRRLYRNSTDPTTIMTSILSGEPVSVADLPAGLDRIVAKALEKNPDLRYQTASEIIRDLEIEQRSRVLFGAKEEEIALPDNETAPREITTTKAQPEPRGVWFITGVVVLLIIIGGAISWFHSRKTTTPPEVPLALGRVRLLQEQYPEAVAQFEQALAIDPRNEGAYHGLAQAYAAMGLTDKAEESWRSDIALHPNSVDPYDQLAKFEFNRRNYPVAVANFRAALKLAPQDSAILSDLGAALSHAGSPDESRRVLEQSIHLAPSFSAWNNLGDLDLKQDRFADAAADYTKALGFNSADYHVWTNLAIAYSRTPSEKEKTKDAFDNATRMCREALEPHPNDPAILSDLAAILALQPDGRLEAQTLIKRVLSSTPDDSHVEFNAAQTYAALGHRKLALSFLQKLIGSGYPLEDIKSSPILGDLVKYAHPQAATQQRIQGS
jgi:serine/threonine protein kinase/Flp pilus assembly protein TadD